MVCAGPAQADEERLDWPLRPRPAVTRLFDAPSPNWNRGHRGVDLAGTPGQPVYAAAAGTVVFAGELAGRPLVSRRPPGRPAHQLRTGAARRCAPGSWSPPGRCIGELVAGHPGCAAPACLHWGAMWGPAARADYVDPLGLLATTPIRLKPLHG